MGIVAMKDPHDKRSSSMSNVMRWRREHSRKIFRIAFISFAVLVVSLWLLYSTSAKEVTLVLDGQSTVVETSERNVQEMLDEQGIIIGVHDSVSAALDAKISEGDILFIDHAKKVQVTADGKTWTVHTISETIGEMLQEQHISLGSEDQVIPAQTVAVAEDDMIRVIRVKKVVEEQKQIVPFKVVKEPDPNLLKGKLKMVQSGKEGVLVQQVEKTYVDGKMVGKRVVSTAVQSESIDKIVAVGSKKPVTILSAASPTVQEVTKQGVQFGVKQILNNVTLSAYSAGIKSTGKTKEHAQYGITYSGTRVAEGRTIAVDPKVIPIGWWVYIDDLGFRRAEDIGSAVKGKHIDVFYEDVDHAVRFGIKRGTTVYVVGPKKPAAD